MKAPTWTSHCTSNLRSAPSDMDGRTNESCHFCFYALDICRLEKYNNINGPFILTRFSLTSTATGIKIRTMDRYFQRTFRQVSKQRLRALGKNQRSLAKALNVSAAYISQIFSGKKSPPDLSREKNYEILRTWCDFLEIDENELIDLVRHELHRTPLPPLPKYPRFRSVAFSKLETGNEDLINEIRALSAHPAEQNLVSLLLQIYLIGDSGSSENNALVFDDLVESVSKLVHDVDFIETELCDRFAGIDFTWTWDEASGRALVYTDSRQLNYALELLKKYHIGDSPFKYASTVPVVGYVTASEGFDYDEEDFQRRLYPEDAVLPIGVDPGLYTSMYSVRVRGDSLRQFFGDGSILFVKSGSWQEVMDGDFVIYRDKKMKKAFARKIEFCDDFLLLKPMNSACRDMVLDRSELTHFERVIAVVF